MAVRLLGSLQPCPSGGGFLAGLVLKLSEFRVKSRILAGFGTVVGGAADEVSVIGLICYAMILSG